MHAMHIYTLHAHVYLCIYIYRLDCMHTHTPAMHTHIHTHTHTHTHSNTHSLTHTHSHTLTQTHTHSHTHTLTHTHTSASECATREVLRTTMFLASMCPVAATQEMLTTAASVFVFPTGRDGYVRACVRGGFRACVHSWVSVCMIHVYELRLRVSYACMMHIYARVRYTSKEKCPLPSLSVARAKKKKENALPSHTGESTCAIPIPRAPCPSVKRYVHYNVCVRRYT